MTERTLRAALHDIAERAPEIVPDPTLFDRGRSAATRSRVLRSAAVVAAVLLVGAVGWQALRPAPTPVADGPEGAGVPETIHVPSDGWTGDLPTVRDWDGVAPVVASYVSEGVSGEVVLVSADGRYRRTTPESITGTFMPDLVPTLSPDGTRLAYAYATDGPVGIAVLDLRDGDETLIRIGGADDVLARSLQWSPNGDRLIWSGQRVTAVDRDPPGESYRLGGARAGVISGLAEQASRPRVNALPAASRPARSGWDGAGICDDGAVVTWRWPRFVVTTTEGSPAPTRVRSWSEVTRAHGPCAAPLSVLAADPSGDPAAPVVLGWIPEGYDEDSPTAVVLGRDYETAARDSWRTSSLLLVTPESAAAGESQRVGAVDGPVDGLSVATGLMTLERPTVAAAESPWATPWWQQPALGVLLVALGGVAVLGWWLRRRLR